MATLEEQRRASGARMEASRRAGGAAMEAQRRAGGDAMIKRRTGRDEVADVNALVQPPRQRQALKPAPVRGGIPAAIGTGTYQAPAASPSTGGMASPLTEKDNSRTYHPTAISYSNSYLLAIEIKPVKSLVMIDSDGNEHTFNFDGTPP